MKQHWHALQLFGGWKYQVAFTSTPQVNVVVSLYRRCFAKVMIRSAVHPARPSKLCATGGPSSSIQEISCPKRHKPSVAQNIDSLTSCLANQRAWKFAMAQVPWMGSGSIDLITMVLQVERGSRENFWNGIISAG